MRVGLVCPYMWNVPGGVQQHVRGLAEALVELGHEVSVIAPVGGAPDGRATDGSAGRFRRGQAGEPLPPYVVPAGRAIPVPYNGSVARLAFGSRPAGRVRRWLREGRFDVLHVHEPVAPSLSLLACWMASGPIVATAHTSNVRSRVMAAGYPLLQAVMEKISGWIAVSDAARRTLVEHLGENAVLIPNGVATHRFHRAEPWPGWPGEGGALGFLGRLDERRKGLPVLLAAFGALAPHRPGLRLLLAGPGSGELHTLPTELRCRVARLGRVSEEGKARTYQSVDAFVAPNLGGESFGLVLAEAMAAGAPILASDIAAFRRVLDEGRAGVLFDVGDPNALAGAATALLDDPERQAVLSRRARKAVRAYDWATVARDVAGVYEAAAARAGGVVEEARSR